MATTPDPRSLPAAGALLGILGVAGGLGLLAAFVIEIPPALNTWRIILFNAGAIAIGLATFRRHAAVSRRMAIAGALPLIAANAGYLVWIAVASGRPSPFSDDLGLVGFWLSLAMWLADAWFGLVALRIGAVPRWVAAMLAAGSLLAIVGIDRLGLTSSASPTPFGPLAMAGAALNGAAWVVLGIVVLRWVRGGARPEAAREGSAAVPQPPSRA
jgi:hypothetical protein